MSGRNANITVQNNSGYNWTKSAEDIEHGKVTNSPSDPVNNGENWEIDVSNHDGQTMGPKGTYQWSAVFANSQLVTILLSWNHPWSGATSAYTLSSTPTGALSSQMSPANPTGHDQSITFSVSAAS